MKTKILENMHYEADRPLESLRELERKVGDAEQWRHFRENVRRGCMVDINNRRRRRCATHCGFE